MPIVFIFFFFKEQLIICFIIDLIMAVCFVINIINNPTKPYWFYTIIGITKLFGDFFAFIYYAKTSSYIIPIGIIVLVLNLIYVVCSVSKLTNKDYSRTKYS